LKEKNLETCLLSGIVMLLIFSALIPITFGYNIKTKNIEITVEKDNFNKCPYPGYYNCYNTSETSDSTQSDFDKKQADFKDIESNVVNKAILSSQPSDGPMDSSWPMYCHDVKHTGRSPYSTVDTWDEV
jgi:hypothetical protein